MKLTGRKVFLFALALAVSLAFAACGGGAATPSGSGTAPTPQISAAGGAPAADAGSPSPTAGNFTPGPNSAAGTQPLYGEYTLLKTLDVNGNIKVPKTAVSSLTLKNDNTYELVFGDGSESAGSVSAYSEDISGLPGQGWQFALTDDRNSGEPSYTFVMRVQDDGSICVLSIPQGVGDNSWLSAADFWVFEK